MKNKMEDMAKTMLPTKEFNRELDHHIDFVKKTMIGSKSFQPMLILKTAKGNTLPCMFDSLADTSEGRAKQMEDVGRKIVEVTHKNKDVVVMAMFMSEVWYAMGSKDKENPLPPEVTLPLKDSPVKAEGISIAGTTVDGRQNMSVLPIMRAKDGTPMIVEAKIETSYCDDTDKNDGSVNYIMRGFWRGYLMKLMGK